MIKIMTVFGTRPEAIKMCPLVNELKSNDAIETVVCVTGQHKEMLDTVLDIFNIIPKYNLNIMQESQNLFDVTINILNKLKPILEYEKPNLILVHGDTSTAFAAGLASYYLQIPVGHVEAGLRTYNKYSPYPEEFNRQAIGSLADIHFAPTSKSANNLINEGIDEKKIHVTGNTSIDALKSTIRSDYSHPELDWASDSKLILITAHRRENLGKPMRNMFKAIKRVINENNNIKVIFPIHLNPKVRSLAEEYFKNSNRIHIIEPLDVLDFHNFMNKSYFILSDSGGIQEEAPALGKPVLVMRDTTERPEGLEAGTLRLVGTKEEKIYKKFNELINDEKVYEEMANAYNPYGDGSASQKIVRAILDNF